MHGVLHVSWRVSPLAFPRVWRHCDHCKDRRPFDCSSKFRSNAQKKRLDVWLIYHCGHCGQSWNLPIHERRRIADIDPALFQAFAANDAALVRHHAFDVAHLRRHADRVEPAGGICVEKLLRQGSPASAQRLVIGLALAMPCEVRLERLLSHELAVSRPRLRALHAADVVTVAPPVRAALRRPVKDGQAVTIALSRLPREVARSLAEAACGLPAAIPARYRDES